MPIRITVKNLQSKIRLYPSQIIQKTKKILKHERIFNAELSLVFVTDQKIKALNQKYLKHSWATDVLAFDLRKTPDEQQVVGEIIISTGRAMAQAKHYQTSASEEILLYVIHGILHLRGFRDQTLKATQRMRTKEQQLLDFLR